MMRRLLMVAVAAAMLLAPGLAWADGYDDMEASFRRYVAGEFAAAAASYQGYEVWVRNVSAAGQSPQYEKAVVTLAPAYTVTFEKSTAPETPYVGTLRATILYAYSERYPTLAAAQAAEAAPRTGGQVVQFDIALKDGKWAVTGGYRLFPRYGGRHPLKENNIPEALYSEVRYRAEHGGKAPERF